MFPPTFTTVILDLWWDICQVGEYRRGCVRMEEPLINTFGNTISVSKPGIGRSLYLEGIMASM